MRWALSPLDYRAHAVTDATGGPPGGMVARCGHHLPVAAGLDEVPRAALCAGCAVMVAPEVEDRAALIRASRPEDDLDGCGTP